MDLGSTIDVADDTPMEILALSIENDEVLASHLNSNYTHPFIAKLLDASKAKGTRTTQHQNFALIYLRRAMHSLVHKNDSTTVAALDDETFHPLPYNVLQTNVKRNNTSWSYEMIKAVYKNMQGIIAWAFGKILEVNLEANEYKFFITLLDVLDPYLVIVVIHSYFTSSFILPDKLNVITHILRHFINSLCEKRYVKIVRANLQVQNMRLLSEKCYVDLLAKLMTMAFEVRYHTINELDLDLRNVNTLPFPIKKYLVNRRNAMAHWAYPSVENIELEEKIYNTAKVVTFKCKGAITVFDVIEFNVVTQPPILLNATSWQQRLAFYEANRNQQEPEAIKVEFIEEYDVIQERFKFLWPHATSVYVKTNGIGPGTIFFKILNKTEVRNSTKFLNPRIRQESKKAIKLSSTLMQSIL